MQIKAAHFKTKVVYHPSHVCQSINNEGFLKLDYIIVRKQSHLLMSKISLEVDRFSTYHNPNEHICLTHPPTEILMDFKIHPKIYGQSLSKPFNDSASQKSLVFYGGYHTSDVIASQIGKVIYNQKSQEANYESMNQMFIMHYRME